MPPSKSPSPGPHFTWQEMGNPPSSKRAATRKLVRHLERLRAIRGGRPLPIVSAYRDPDHNRRVGGAPQSQHLQAAAADIPEGYATVAQAMEAGFTGIGSKGRWAIHVDVRPGRLARWTYD